MLATLVGSDVELSPARSAFPLSSSLHVSTEQLMRLAEAALTRGDLATAERAYRALLVDPSQEVRLEARFRLAMMAGKRGNLTQAASLFQQILDHRPNASRVRLELAGLLDRMGDKDGAWRQVRAIHAGGLPIDVARLVDRYSEALRAQRTAGLSVELALAPDSNINRATRSDTLGTVLGDFAIAEDGKAKSGTGASIGASAYRRLPIGNDFAVLIRASGFANLYRHAEFNDLAADLGVGPELNFKRDRIQLEVGATQRWFGQRPLLRSVRAVATVSHRLGNRTLVRVSGAGSLIDNQRSDLQDGRGFLGQVAVEHALTPTTGFAIGASVDRQRLKEAAYATTGWRASVTGWRDLGRMTLTLGAEFGRLRADERLALLPERRVDRYSRISLGATFRQVQLRGFAPLVRVTRERNRSTIAFYDYRRTRTEVGVARAF